MSGRAVTVGGHPTVGGSRDGATSSGYARCPCSPSKVTETGFSPSDVTQLRRSRLGCVLPVSTPAFHELADDVEQTSRRIYSLAREQGRLGNDIPTGSESIEETDAASVDSAKD